MSNDIDAIVIGAGHNGLTTAGYLGNQWRQEPPSLHGGFMDSRAHDELV
jgi:thioredoxin reductase